MSATQLTADQIVEQWHTNPDPISGSVPIDHFASDMHTAIGILVAEVDRLRERCASDPWWWACAEYPDEGWSGPYRSREEAESEAKAYTGEDNGTLEVVFRQHSTPAGCAENERLSAENQELKARIAQWVDELDSALTAMETAWAEMSQRSRQRPTPTPSSSSNSTPGA